MQAFGHAGPKHLVVMDRQQVVGYEPKRLFSRHPLQPIESGHVYRAGKSTQGALSTQIEEDIEIAHGKFAQAAIDRLAIAQPGEV